jgi:small-conductance mechanosensitive channel
MNDSWLATGILIGITLVIAYVIEWLFMPWLRRIAARSSLWLDDLVLDATRGIAFWWVLLVGVTIAATNSPLDAKNIHYVELATKLLWGLSATLLAVRIAGRLVDQRITAAGLPNISLLGNAVRAFVALVGGLVAFSTIGVSITPVLTALGVGGLAVALALQPTLSNLFSGIQLLASKKLHPGDMIKLDSGEEGEITDITWRDTTLRTGPGNLIILPNSKLADARVMNFALPDREMNVAFPVGVAYGSNLAQVETVTRAAVAEAMANHPGAVADFVPVVRFDGFADSSINVVVVVRVKSWADQFMARHHLVVAIDKHYAAAGIEIPFPMRTVVTRPG